MYSVILIDDVEAFLKTLKESFDEDDMFTVVATASDGAEAIEKIEALKPDIIVTDMVMPMVDGSEVVRHARSMTGYEPLICVMTDYEDQLRLQLMRLEIDYIKKKPFNIPSLIKDIKGILIAGPIVREKPKSFLDQAEDIIALFDVPANLICTRITIEAVAQVLEHGESMYPISKVLYPKVAQNRGIKVRSVESNIRFFISKAHNSKLYKTLFRHKLRVTPSLLIDSVVKYIKSEGSKYN